MADATGFVAGCRRGLGIEAGCALRGKFPAATVVMSLPFFVVDVVYMMCFAFERWRANEGTDGWKSMRFNVISGNVTLQLCM